MDLTQSLLGGVDPRQYGALSLASIPREITPGFYMAYPAILALGDGRRAGYAANPKAFAL